MKQIMTIFSSRRPDFIPKRIRALVSVRRTREHVGRERVLEDRRLVVVGDWGIFARRRGAARFVGTGWATPQSSIVLSNAYGSVYVSSQLIKHHAFSNALFQFYDEDMQKPPFLPVPFQDPLLAHLFSKREQKAIAQARKERDLTYLDAVYGKDYSRYLLPRGETPHLQDIAYVMFAEKRKKLDDITLPYYISKIPGVMKIRVDYAIHRRTVDLFSVAVPGGPAVRFTIFVFRPAIVHVPGTAMAIPFKPGIYFWRLI